MAILARRCADGSSRSPLAPITLPTNHDDHLIKMPIAAENGSHVVQVSGNRRTKFEEPAPYALVGNIQTSLRKKIIHIPIAQSEPGIEPNGASNDFRWKAVTF